METFAIIGFIFSLPAFAMAAANKAEVKKLRDELGRLQKAISELRDGQGP